MLFAAPPGLPFLKRCEQDGEPPHRNASAMLSDLARLGNTEGVLNSAQNFAVGYLYSAWGEGK